MLSVTFPYPPTKGGTQVRTFNLLKELSKNHQITLVTQANNDVQPDDIIDLQKWVEKLQLFLPPKQASTSLVNKTRRFGNFLLQGTPPNVMSSYCDRIQQWIDQAVADNDFDAITCEHSINEIYVRPAWRHKLKTLVNIHSSVYRTCQNQLETGTSENPKRDRLYLPLLRRYEQNFCQKFSDIVVTTEEDKQQILEFNSQANIWVVPNGVDLTSFPYRHSDPGGHKLIFFGGMDYIANIDAACFFAQEILPKLQQLYPKTTLSIVGANPSPKILKLAELPGIIVTGRVAAIADYLHQATVCVIPMRTGFGIKNKTLEAMAAGIPIVASDRGLVGIEVDNPLLALRANTVDEYITEISRLFEDVELRNKLSCNARKAIEQEYTWSNLANRYEQVISNK